MVKIIQDDRINELIGKMIPKQLLDQGPIIAGGSILAQYRLPYYASQVFRPDNLGTKFLDIFNGQKKFSYDAQREWLKSHMDIDIWFDQDHQFWDESNPGNVLVKGYDKNTVHSLPRTSFSQYGLYQPTRSSVYANTYNPTEVLAGRQIQIIRDPAKSIEGLIESFDFTNVSIAWHNDSTYILDGLDEAFTDNELRPNRDTLYCDLNISSKIYQGLRAFKYVERYSLQMSPSLCKQILDIYLDIGVYRANEKTSSSTSTGTVQLNGGPYGTRLVSTQYIDRQLQAFMDKFDRFVKMDNFKPEWLFYVVNIIPDIQKYIDRFTKDGKYVENCFAGHTNDDIMLAAFGRS